MSSPLEISIALHYWTRPGDYDDFTPAVRKAIDSFVEAGLLRRTPLCDQLYVGTPGLRVYVEALCAVPRPVQQWVIPEE